MPERHTAQADVEAALIDAGADPDTMTLQRHLLPDGFARTGS